MRTRPWMLMLMSIALVQFASNGVRAEETKAEAASKGEAGDDVGALYDPLDLNHDGKLSLEEIPASQQALIKRLLRVADTNKDGSLSKSEFVAGLTRTGPERPLDKLPEPSPAPAPAKPAERPNAKNANQPPQPVALERIFQQIDKNGDGSLTEDEVPSDRPRLVNVLPAAIKSHNGKLTLEDFKKVLGNLGQNRPERPERPKAAGRPEAKPANSDSMPEKPVVLEKPAAMQAKPEAMSAKPDVMLEDSASSKPAPAKPAIAAKGNRVPAVQSERRFARMDANHDGKISRDEFLSPNVKRFDKLDVNGDGQIDAAEFKAGLPE